MLTTRPLQVMQAYQILSRHATPSRYRD